MTRDQIEVAVVGDGPAGSALAQQLTRLGVETVLFGEDREWAATYTTWIDDLDDVTCLDGVDIWMHRFASVAADFQRPMTVERPYGVIDNDRLRAALRHRVTHEIGPGVVGRRDPREDRRRRDRLALGPRST